MGRASQRDGSWYCVVGGKEDRDVRKSSFWGRCQPTVRLDQPRDRWRNDWGTRKLSEVNTGRGSRLGATNSRRRWASESSKWPPHKTEMTGGRSLVPLP